MNAYHEATMFSTRGQSLSCVDLSVNFVQLYLCLYVCVCMLFVRRDGLPERSPRLGQAPTFDEHRRPLAPSKFFDK